MKAGEWTLRSRRVVTPSGTRAADVLIRNETIAELLEYDGPEAEGVILDVGGLAVLPGLVALHRGALGSVEGLGFEAATRRSAAGGVTTLIDLPPFLDVEPAEVLAPSSLGRIAEAEGRIRVDCGLVMPLGRGEVDRIPSWIEAGFLGVEANFGDGGRHEPKSSKESGLLTAMPILAGLGRPLLVDLGRLGRPDGTPGETDRSSSPSDEREFASIRLAIRLCRETHCRVHLISLGASEALPMIAEARAEGLPLSVEICPNHLGFAFGNPDDGASRSPQGADRPGPETRSRFWAGLESGLIDSIGSGLGRPYSSAIGAPADEMQRVRSEANSPRLTLPSAWAEANRRGFTLDHLARWLAEGTAKVMGLSGRKGSIAPGLDADFVVFDPEAGADREKLAGQVEATVLRGTMIYQSGRFFEHPRGSVVLRLEETQPIQGSDD